MHLGSTTVSPVQFRFNAKKYIYIYIKIPIQFSRTINIFPDETTATKLFNGIPFNEIPVCNIKVSPNNTIINITDHKGNLANFSTFTHFYNRILSRYSTLNSFMWCGRLQEHAERHKHCSASHCYYNKHSIIQNKTNTYL